MPKSNPPAADLSNSGAIEAAIKTGVANIIAYEGERSLINDKISAERKTIKALGVPLPALTAAIHRYKQDEEKRKAYDAGYDLARRALGIPFLESPLLPLAAAPGDPAVHDAEGPAATTKH